jgi:hypothetical protein
VTGLEHLQRLLTRARLVDIESTGAQLLRDEVPHLLVVVDNEKSGVGSVRERNERSYVSETYSSALSVTLNEEFVVRIDVDK